MRLARIFLAIAALALSVGAGPAHAQAPVRMLVGYPPGGAIDTLGRLFAEKLAEGLGRPVVVEIRAGAASQIAAAVLKAAAPDGNTLMVSPEAPIVLSPHTVKTPLPYNTLTDFQPVAHIGNLTYALAVSAGVPANDLKEWLNWVRAGGRNAAYASPGAGTTPQFLGVTLAQAAGVQLVHVPYRGVAPAFVDLMGGQVPAAMLPLAQLLPVMKTGKFRVLAQSAGGRVAAAPEIPSFKELGYQGLEVYGFYGIYAHAGVRPEVIARYNQIIIQSLRTPAMRERMRTLDLEIQEMSPAEMTALIKTQYDRWGPIVKASGYSVDSQ